MNIIERNFTYYKNRFTLKIKNTKNKEYLDVFNQFIKLKYPKGCHSWQIPHKKDSYRIFLKFVDKLITNGQEDKAFEILNKDRETFQDLIDLYQVNKSTQYRQLTYKKMMSYYNDALQSMKTFCHYEDEKQINQIEQELTELEYYNKQKK